MNWLQKRIRDSKDVQESIYESGINKLEVVDRNKKEVQLKNVDGLKIEFISCSYLGLECDPRLGEASKLAIDKYGVQFAAARTRINPELSYKCDRLLSQIFNAPTVTFVTCGLVHLGVLPLLGSKELPNFPVSEQGIYWIMDKSSHASIQILMALMNQFGEVIRVDFNDLNEIRKAFQTSLTKGLTPVTVSDGIGSMGGNAPVLDLIQLAEEYNGYCYIDDAHGTSILGKNGGGFVLDILNNKFNKRLLLVSSLAKAFGATGGAISVFYKETASFISKYANPYIFGGPLALPSLAAIIASCEIHLSDEIYDLQRQLYDNIRFFDALELPYEVLNKNKQIPIRGIQVNDEYLAIKLGKYLLENGFVLTCATFPTVAKGKAMLRLAISALHSTQQLSRLVDLITIFSKKKL